MNMRLLIFVLIIIFSACKQTPSTEHKQEEIAVRDTVIHLVEALDAQPQEFNISEIADSWRKRSIATHLTRSNPPTFRIVYGIKRL